LKISAKKGLFLISVEKQISPLLAPPGKILEKPLVAPPGKNPSDAHARVRCTYGVDQGDFCIMLICG